MSNNRLFSEPDEDSGPAFLDREPILLPEERKAIANELENNIDELKEEVKRFTNR